jgi:hypothetical protein
MSSTLIVGDGLWHVLVVDVAPPRETPAEMMRKVIDKERRTKPHPRYDNQAPRSPQRRW